MLNTIRTFHMILTIHQFAVAKQLIYLKWNWKIIHSYIRKLIIRQVNIVGHGHVYPVVYLDFKV